MYVYNYMAVVVSMIVIVKISRCAVGITVRRLGGRCRVSDVEQVVLLRYRLHGRGLARRIVATRRVVLHVHRFDERVVGLVGLVPVRFFHFFTIKNSSLNKSQVLI